MNYIHHQPHFQLNQPTSVVLGNFDGFHQGHRKLIETCKVLATSHRLESVIFTLFPHPAHLLAKKSAPPLIYTHSEKLEVVNKLDVSHYVELPFTQEVAKMEPKKFVEQILWKQLKAKVIVVGEDFRFGFQRSGNVALLQHLGEQYDIEIHSISPVKLQNKVISSTSIRDMISEGRIEEANRLLTEPFFMMGTVTHGLKNGKSLGFPTINLSPESNKLLPACGVYVTQTALDGNPYLSVTNIGYKPTVTPQSPLSIETHLLDFDQDCYEKPVEITFLKRIRDEKRFDSLNDLKDRIQLDIQYARNYFQEQLGSR